MPYLMMDDAYFDHPKVESLSDAAYRLHGGALFHAARYRLDGYLTVEQLRARKRWSPKAEAELVTALLLHLPADPCDSPKCPPADGVRYRLHDFLQWNKPRAWWDAEAARKAKNKADYLARKAHRS